MKDLLFSEYVVLLTLEELKGATVSQAHKWIVSSNLSMLMVRYPGRALSLASVCVALERLEQSNLIEIVGHGKRTKKAAPRIYGLTEHGRTQFSGWQYAHHDFRWCIEALRDACIPRAQGAAERVVDALSGMGIAS